MHEVNTLMMKGAIEKCLPVNNQFLSSYFLVPKSDGSKRFILNLKPLNKFINSPHFKMEDSRTLMKLLQQDNFMATLDLKDAYFLVPIHRNYRKYLRFKICQGLYQFKCLPFGLSVAPYVFTKIMKPVLQRFREQGIMVVGYLDDLCVISNSELNCKVAVEIIHNTLMSLGFIINLKKTTPPSKKCKYLGFVFDSSNMTLELTMEKRAKIYNFLINLSNLKRCKIKYFAQFIGLLIAACPAIKYGKLYTKIFEREKFLALRKSKQNYNKTMIIRDIIKRDLCWWKSHILLSKNSIKQDVYVLEIYTDASRTGWGAVCGNAETYGWWSKEDLKKHINYLELKAIYYGLKCFASDFRSCNVLIRSDNTTAIAYVNRMGSIQKPELNRVSRKIWTWCENRDIWVHVSYVQSKENIADLGSRVFSPETEWELADYAFTEIKNKWGCPVIDLFASKANHKCKKYVSWMRDPDSLTIDAFTFSWSNIFFYAFPPFALILRSLKKIITDKAEGIMVVPNWPLQPWYPLFQKLLKSKPIIFYPSSTLLSSPFRNSHPMKTSLTLVAGKLCGQHIN